jgi:hypothetical protein
MHIRKVLQLSVLVAAATLSVEAQAKIKYGFEYKCGSERVVVFYCRNDPGNDGGRPVHESENYCAVEYPDRPRANPQFPVPGSVLRSDLLKQLASCTAAPSSDPAVAKAQAAKVDTVVFGIELGEPFGLPKCPLLQVGSGLKTCYSTLVDEIAGLIAGPGSPSPASRTVFLGVNECPSWVNGCKLVVTNFDRKVGIVDVYTKGPSVDTVVVGVLKEKYGNFQGLVTERTVTPGDRQRAPFKVTLLTWHLPGLTVAYEPVWADDGHTPNIDEGIIRVETESARKARIAAPKTPRPKM